MQKDEKEVIETLCQEMRSEVLGILGVNLMKDLSREGFVRKWPEVLERCVVAYSGSCHVGPTLTRGAL